MSSLESCQNINEQENHDGGKGKGMGAKGEKGKRAKTTNCNFPCGKIFAMHNRQSYKTLGIGVGQVTRAFIDSTTEGAISL